MEQNQTGQPFSTAEGMLACCLYAAGCEFADPSRPCFNLYDPTILAGMGYKGEKLFQSALDAWKKKARGHVEYSFILTQRTHDLILIYREQRKELEDSDAKASDLIAGVCEKIARGSILPDEGALRIACILLKIRSEFMNMWKEMVPLLRIPEPGKARHFETTATVRTKAGMRTVPAQGVAKPGFKLISLNVSEETKKKLKL